MFVLNEAQAQSVSQVTIRNTANTDTVVAVLNSTAGYSSLAIQPVVTKVSGTTGGSVVITGSLDGVNYLAISDTLTLTNVTTAQTKLWTFSGAPYRYYRVRFITSGSQVNANKLYYIFKKHD